MTGLHGHTPQAARPGFRKARGTLHSGSRCQPSRPTARSRKHGGPAAGSWAPEGQGVFCSLSSVSSYPPLRCLNCKMFCKKVPTQLSSLAAVGGQVPLLESPFPAGRPHEDGTALLSSQAQRPLRSGARKPFKPHGLLGASTTSPHFSEAQFYHLGNGGLGLT